MIQFVLRLFYNITIYPVALGVWWLRRRSTLRVARGAKLRLTRMPQTALGQSPFRRLSLADLATDLDKAGADPLGGGLFVSLGGFNAGAVAFLLMGSLIQMFKAA